MTPARRRILEYLRSRLTTVEVNLRIQADEIDAIGEEMFALRAGLDAPMNPDQIACYASNTLQGTQALLREMGALLGPAARKKGRRR